MKNTPLKKIKEYCENNFKDIIEAQNYIRKNGTDDYMAINNILYTMIEYDEDGEYVDYYNVRNNTGFRVSTKNRYKNGFGDAIIELDYGWYRDGINYAD